jgi:transcription termination factor Rho
MNALNSAFDKAPILVATTSLGIENIARAKKQALIFSILKYKADNDEEVLGDGVKLVFF